MKSAASAYRMSVKVAAAVDREIELGIECTRRLTRRKRVYRSRSRSTPSVAGASSVEGDIELNLALASAVDRELLGDWVALDIERDCANNHGGTGEVINP